MRGIFLHISSFVNLLIMHFGIWDSRSQKGARNGAFFRYFTICSYYFLFTYYEHAYNVNVFNEIV